MIRCCMIPQDLLLHHSPGPSLQSKKHEAHPDDHPCRQPEQFYGSRLESRLGSGLGLGLWLTSHSSLDII